MEFPEEGSTNQQTQGKSKRDLIWERKKMLREQRLQQKETGDQEEDRREHNFGNFNIANKGDGIARKDPFAKEAKFQFDTSEPENKTPKIFQENKREFPVRQKEFPQEDVNPQGMQYASKNSNSRFNGIDNPKSQAPAQESKPPQFISGRELIDGRHIEKENLTKDKEVNLFNAEKQQKKQQQLEYGQFLKNQMMQNPQKNPQNTQNRKDALQSRMESEEGGMINRQSQQQIYQQNAMRKQAAFENAYQQKANNPLDDEKNKLQNAPAQEYFPFGRPGAGAPAQRPRMIQNNQPNFDNNQQQNFRAEPPQTNMRSPNQVAFNGNQKNRAEGQNAAAQKYISPPSIPNNYADDQFNQPQENYFNQDFEKNAYQPIKSNNVNQQAPNNNGGNFFNAAPSNINNRDEDNKPRFRNLLKSENEVVNPDKIQKGKQMQQALLQQMEEKERQKKLEKERKRKEELEEEERIKRELAKMEEESKREEEKKKKKVENLFKENLEIQQEAKNKRQMQKSQEEIPENGPFPNILVKEKPVAASRKQLIDNSESNKNIASSKQQPPPQGNNFANNFQNNLNMNQNQGFRGDEANNNMGYAMNGGFGMNPALGMPGLQYPGMFPQMNINPYNQQMIAPEELLRQRYVEMELQNMRLEMQNQQRNMVRQLDEMKNQANLAIELRDKAEKEMEGLREQLRNKMYQDHLYQQNLLMALSKNQPMPPRPLYNNENVGSYQPASKRTPALDFSLAEPKRPTPNLLNGVGSEYNIPDRLPSREVVSREIAQRPAPKMEVDRRPMVQYSNQNARPAEANVSIPKRTNSLKPERERKLNYNGSLLEAESKFVPIDILDKFQDATDESALTLSKVANFGLRPNSSKLFKTNSEPKSNNYVNINTHKVNSIRPISHLNSRGGIRLTEEDNGSLMSVNNELSKEIDRLLRKEPTEFFADAGLNKGKMGNDSGNNSGRLPPSRKNFNMVAQNILNSGSNALDDGDDLGFVNQNVNSRPRMPETGVKPRILSGKSNFITVADPKEPGQYTINTEGRGIILDTEFPSLKDQNTFFPNYDEKLVEKYRGPQPNYPRSDNENSGDRLGRVNNERKWSAKGRRPDESHLITGAGMNTLDIQNLNRKYDEKLSNDGYMRNRMRDNVRELDFEEEDEELKKLDSLLKNYKK